MKKELNIFDWLEGIYNKKYKDEYDVTFKDFIELFFENTFGINTGSIHEGFIGESDIEDSFIGEFIPSVKIDTTNKTIKMFISLD